MNTNNTSSRGWVNIVAVSNGYTIEVYRRARIGHSILEEYVARSWAEVLEILKDTDGPDFIKDDRGE